MAQRRKTRPSAGGPAYATGAPNTAMIPSPVNWLAVPPYRCTAPAARLTSSAMISRRRSGPTAAAMSMECATSANNTVTCLYSADRVASVSGEPHSLQNFAVALNWVPHEPHDSSGDCQRAGTVPIVVHVSIVSPQV